MPEEVDVWLANESVTHEKMIEGKTVTFKSKPNGSMIDRLAARFRNTPDKANVEMVKHIVISPKIDDAYWDKLHAGVRMQILEECLSVCGLQPGFLR